MQAQRILSLRMMKNQVGSWSNCWWIALWCVRPWSMWVAMCVCVSVLCVCPAWPSLSLSTCLSPSVFTWAGHIPGCKGCKKLRKLLEPSLNACIPSCYIISMWIDKLKGTKGLRRRVLIKWDLSRWPWIQANVIILWDMKWVLKSQLTNLMFVFCLIPCQRAHKHVAMKKGGLCMRACMLQLIPFSSSG